MSEQKETQPDVSDTSESESDVPTTHEHQETEQAEETHVSLSARVLKGLFLIAVGIGLALWGAPKLAPMLPQGLAPVAEFLMPGQSAAKAEVVALRVELDEKLRELEARTSNVVAQEDIAKAIADYDAQNTEALNAIKDQFAATDGQAIEARLATVENKLEGVTAELAAMSDRLSLQITENGTALSEEAASKLSGYQAVIDGMKAQLEALAAKNGILSQKIDEVSSSSTRRVQEAEQNATAKVATTATTKLLTDINSALNSGASFQASLDGLAKISNSAPPPDLAAIAATGTTSLIDLRDQFSEVAHTALRADTKANASDGVIGKFGAFLRTQVGSRSLERRDGDDTDAVLSRIEDELGQGNLSAAVAESKSLKEAPKAAMADWLAALERLSAAQSAMAQLTSSLGVSN